LNFSRPAPFTLVSGLLHIKLTSKVRQTATARRSQNADSPGVSTAFGQAPHPGSLLSAAALSPAELRQILDSAHRLEKENPARRARRLAHRRVALLFYEASTRTRTSFELAAKSLGAESTLVSAQSSSIEKGESLQDTGLTLRAMGVEAIILRHPQSGAAQVLAMATGLPILNAGDGMHEHPSQALLDLRTILQWKFPRKPPTLSPKTLHGLTITICGDILHSRVARSNALLLPRLGARVLLCGPPTLLPEIAAQLLPQAEGDRASGPVAFDLSEAGHGFNRANQASARRRLQPLKQQASGSIEVHRDFEACLRQSNVVMMLRIQKERLNNLQLDLHGYMAGYQLNFARLQKFAPDALVMHPGPMVRGLEITAEVADGPQSVIEKQVSNGVAIRMALLVRALARKPASPPPKLRHPEAPRESFRPRQTSGPKDPSLLPERWNSRTATTKLREAKR
jgi:aspartate carbamoyltransferase catalytic subunit